MKQKWITWVLFCVGMLFSLTLTGMALYAGHGPRTGVIAAGEVSLVCFGVLMRQNPNAARPERPEAE